MRGFAGSVRRGIVAWVALAGVVLMAAGPVAAGHRVIDVDCLPAVESAHDHNAHRIGQAPAAEAGHCVACHLTRSARGASPSTAATIAAGGGSAAIETDAPAPHRFSTRTDSPRGPPSLA